MGRSWRSGHGLDEREELETVLLGTFKAEPEALLEAAAALLSARSCDSLSHIDFWLVVMLR